MLTRLILVIPCYNEASRLKPQPFLQLIAAKRDVKLLFVDDGSTDGTAAILADIASGGGGRIDVLTLPRNAGKAQAVQRGVLSALDERPELVGYWDADLSTPLSELQQFIDVLDGNPAVDIVLGSRVNLLGRRIERRPFRHYVGRVFATAASLALRVAVYDTQCGAKIFRANDAVRRVFSTPFQSHWAMDVEILARYLASIGTTSPGAKICEVPLRTWTDVPGSNVRVSDAVRAIWDLARIRRQTKRP